MTNLLRTLLLLKVHEAFSKVLSFNRALRKKLLHHVQFHRVWCVCMLTGGLLASADGKGKKQGQKRILNSVCAHRQEKIKAEKSENEGK